MNALFFDYAERRIADSTVILSFRQRTNDEEDVLTVRGFGLPLNAVYVGFYNRKAEFELYQIVDVNENKVTHELTLFCESDMYELVGEKTINDARPTKTTAGLALAQALDGTRFEVGIVDDTSISSTRFFYCSPFAAVRKIETAWPVRARPRYVVSGARIEHRYIDLLSNAPIWRGKRFEIGKDILSASLREDRRNVVTALTGRGKGESVGDGYGRRIDFSNVVWSKANGDPVDKPLGQDWIEDPVATALYGICGTRPRFSVVEFDDIEDDNELILATWNALQAASAPTLSGELSAVALETLGFPHEAAYYGDEIAFISDNRRLRARIVSIEREFAYDGADVFHFGKLSDSTARQMAAVKRDIVTTKDKASAGALIAQKNEGLLSGYLDTMKTQILSTGTKFYTDKYDGGFVFESADGSSAVKLTGSGILIAPTRSADAWDWTLAIDGSGIVADTITSGVINAAVIKIFGTNSFYWDAANINIINPTNTNHQIRIGRFDGVNYGIGFTQDGGQTWQNAIGFDGVNISATGFAKSYVQLNEPTGQGIGDRWTKTDPKTWEEVAAGTWGSIKDITWNEAFGYPYPQTFVWDGRIWVLEADMLITGKTETFDERMVKVETEVEQNAKAITERATKGELESLRVQTAGSISQMVTSEQLDSAVTQNTQNWTAEFNKIGLAGKQTGIVKAGEDGVEVTHSNIGGKTSMNADGFRLYDKDGKVIGGLVNTNSGVVSSVQRLANPERTSFYVEVASKDYDEQVDALIFHYGGNVCGKLSLYSYPDGRVGLMFGSAGETFVGGINTENIYAVGQRIHFSSYDPGGQDGDIWLCPAGD